MQHGWGPASVPISLMSDSYKASHYLQYPDTTKMVAVRHKYIADMMLHLRLQLIRSCLPANGEKFE